MLIGKKFPVIFNKDLPCECVVLMKEEDFALFNLPPTNNLELLRKAMQQDKGKSAKDHNAADTVANWSNAIKEDSFGTLTDTLIPFEIRR